MDYHRRRFYDTRRIAWDLCEALRRGCAARYTVLQACRQVPTSVWRIQYLDIWRYVATATYSCILRSLPPRDGEEVRESEGRLESLLGGR